MYWTTSEIFVCIYATLMANYAHFRRRQQLMLPDIEAPCHMLFS